ncbi:MAG: D-alanyl-D-alanine carboxypeptidase family protein [Clostridia bacterium]|nr:D-alanyl-D-alanine carboxypeptidase family protein [Clostridia bacterium]
MRGTLHNHKIKYVCLAVLFFLFLIAGRSPAWAATQLGGTGAVLLDMQSGQVLFEQAKDERLSPASTTKMLTAIIAIESGKLEETVTIGPTPPKTEGTAVYLEEGERVKLRDLVQAALIFSANDAAAAIAEYIAGTQSDFAVLMNQKAAEIGAQNSNFVNPHGLTAEGHYSTAYDLALLGRYAMQNETFKEIVQMKVYDWAGQAWQTRLINKNEILWSYNGATGVKTGYTKDAKNTIVASAERGGRSYIAAVLGSSGTATWSDAQKLLDLGFDGFQQVKLAQPGEVMTTLSLDEETQLRLAPQQELVISLPVNEDVNKLQPKVSLKPLTGDIREGDHAGSIVYYLDDREVGALELVYADTFIQPYNYLQTILYGLAGLFCLQVLWRLYRLTARKQRRNRGYSYGGGSSVYNMNREY